MKKEILVTKLNDFLTNSKFVIIICGDFDIPFDELKSGDNKYVQILNRYDKSCYIDWVYKDFNKKELKKFCKEIPEYQGSGEDEISKEYCELGELILKYLKTN